MNKTMLPVQYRKLNKGPCFPVRNDSRFKISPMAPEIMKITLAELIEMYCLPTPANKTIAIKKATANAIPEYRFKSMSQCNGFFLDCNIGFR